MNPDLLANFNFSISGVTITGGKETTAVGGGGIISGSIDNTMSVTNCVISGNSATGVGTFGGGGIRTAGGSLTITGTTFSNNSTSRQRWRFGLHRRRSADQNAIYWNSFDKRFDFLR